MKHFLSTLDDPVKDPAVATFPHPLIVGRVGHVIAHILGRARHPDSCRSAP